MGFAQVQSCAVVGLGAARVMVEVHLANGLPNFTLVGLADTEVRESRERVRSAILGYNINSNETNLNTLTNFLKVETRGSNSVFTVDLDGAGSGTAAQTITLEGTTFNDLTLSKLINNQVLKV